MFTQVPRDVIFAFLPTLEIIFKNILWENSVTFGEVGLLISIPWLHLCLSLFDRNAVQFVTSA